MAVTVPVFLILMSVLTVWPGTMAMLPPYLLIVAQVALFVETEPPSVLLHTIEPSALVSCIVSVPVPSVLAEFLMLATKAE